MKIERCVALVTGANRGLGAAFARGLLAAGALDSLQRQFETNAAGPLRLVQAFAPVLAGNGGGAVVNMLSVLSWLALPGRSGGYSASKAAGWALSNALRQELKAQGTALLAVHAGLAGDPPLYIRTGA